LTINTFCPAQPVVALLEVAVAGGQQNMHFMPKLAY